MPQKIRIIGRVRVLEKNGRRHHYEVSACDGILSIATHSRHYGGSDGPVKRLRVQERTPVRQPPNVPDKPPVKEPAPKTRIGNRRASRR